MQQLAHRVGTNLLPHRPQRLGQLDLALGNPQQGAHRIATRDRLHQPAQILEQCRILDRQRPAPAAIAPNPPRGQTRPPEILQPTPDRTARYARRARHRRCSPAFRRARLRRREKPPPALIKLTTDRFKASSYCVFVNHPLNL